MTKSDLIKILHNPALMGNEHIVELEDVVNDYPFFQAARVLHLQGLNRQNSFRFNQILKTTALYTFDRSILYHLFSDNLSEERVALDENQINQLLTDTVTSSEYDVENDFSEDLTPSDVFETETQPDNQDYQFDMSMAEDVIEDSLPIEQQEETEHVNFDLENPSNETLAEEKEFELPGLDDSLLDETEENVLESVESDIERYNLPEIEDALTDELAEESLNQFTTSADPNLELSDLDIIKEETDIDDFARFTQSIKNEAETSEASDLDFSLEQAEIEDFTQFTQNVEASDSHQMATEEFDEDIILSNELETENEFFTPEEAPVEHSETGDTHSENPFFAQELLEEIDHDENTAAFSNELPEIEAVENLTDTDHSTENLEEGQIFSGQPVEIHDDLTEEPILEKFQPEENPTEEKDEEIIFELIPDEIFSQAFEESVEEAPKPKAEEPVIPEAPLPFNKQDAHYSFNDWLKIYSYKTSNDPDNAQNKPSLDKKMEIIDEFISNNPKIEPIKNTKPIESELEKEAENEEIMTETLARVYVLQHKYTDAIKAYEILSLKFPEKSSFFASQIKQIENLRRNNN